MRIKYTTPRRSCAVQAFASTAVRPFKCLEEWSAHLRRQCPHRKMRMHNVAKKRAKSTRMRLLECPYFARTSALVPGESTQQAYKSGAMAMYPATRRSLYRE